MTEQRVLIIDDEPDIRELLEITLLRMGLDTMTAGNVADAIDLLKTSPPDLCLTDMKLPDGTGIDIARFIQQNHPDIPVAVITAYGSMDTAVEALKAGAYDFVSKPVELPKLRDLIQTALKLSKADGGTVVTEQDNDEQNIIGKSQAMHTLRSTIKKLARSQAPVYIHGESGSGKELVSNQIHLESPRREGPFVPVNCGAIPENLMESEFFGHKKGSFTGAVTDKQGLFQAAHKGTLFLDEVADLPLSMQVKLLRAIQERAIKPVGGLEEINVDVRILSATHKSLEHEVAANRFRQDLYYRLNVIKLDVPPLRDRGEDTLLLANFFLTKIADRWQMSAVKLAKTAQQALLTYNFPGNVRELENILERACTLCENNTIHAEDLQLPAADAIVPTPTQQQNWDQTIPIPVTNQPIIAEPIGNNNTLNWAPGTNQRDERNMIIRALELTRWNRTKAAEMLGMSFRQLRYRIQKYELEVE